MNLEDICQALGFPPERKYQQEGGPLLRDCIALLRDWSTAPVLDIRSLIDGLIFNVLIGNADAHGKNFLLLYQGGQRRLAPFYDLVCTMAWPEVSDHLSMKIGGCKTLKEITSVHWQKKSQKEPVSPALKHFAGVLNVPHVFQAVMEMDAVDAHCFDASRAGKPFRVPLRTLLTQLV
jgi:serine/threonine-protein kinase HipA